MLNKQRREKPLVRKAVKDGKRVVRERFGVDSDTCTGDHSCIRLSACPSLTIQPNPDPLRQDPVAHVENSRSEEHTSELQSLMRSSYAVFCLKQKTKLLNPNHK